MRGELIEQDRTQRVRTLVCRPRSARVYLLASIVAAVLVVAVVLAVRLVSHWGPPSPTGDPDPGGQRLDALRPALHSLPAGVSNVAAREYEPVWDSCDGRRSTYGWDDATITISFDAYGMTASAIVSHVDDALRSSGWVVQPSGGGAWYWTNLIAPGVHAQIQLLGGSGVEPPNPWSLVATAPPATHPVKGC